MRRKTNSHAGSGLARQATNLQETTALLEIAIGRGSTGFAFIDRNYRFLQVNEQLARMNGLHREEHLGLSVRQVAGPEQWQARERFLRRAFEGEQSIAQPLTGLMPHRTGARRLLASYYPVRVDGIVVGAAVYYDDITDGVDHQLVLDGSERQLHAIFESTLDAILIGDDQLCCVDANPAACSLFGFSHDNLVGRRITDFIAPDLQACIDSLQQSVRQAGRQFGEIVLVTSDGTHRIVEYSSTSEFAPGLHLFLLRDITDRRQAEQVIQSAHEGTRAMANRQRAFLTDVLASVTEGKLRLCDNADELPKPLVRFGDPVVLDQTGGLSDLRRLASDAAHRQAFPEVRSDDLTLATSEVATNAIKHGGGGIGAVYADAGGPVQVWVADTGRGISMENLPKATLARGYTTSGTMGHGMKIALQTIDRMWLLTGPTGTAIVLEQDYAPEPSIWD